MIWQVVVWTFWRVRNNIIFKVITKTSKEVEEKNYFLAEKWFIGRSGLDSWSYSDWLQNLIIYLNQ